ncbi:putative RNA-directed DNA polymerase [Helianthus annuus]|nr:putative RNA-directed DNA polymerase [Helianthus annuus]
MFRMATVDAIGASGGLASMWDPTVFTCTEVISSRFFLCVCGLLIPTGMRLNIVNVYASNDPSTRKLLWLDLLHLKNSKQGLWIFLGDFNEVRDESERVNSEFNATNAVAFNDFILSAALHDLPLGGAQFTYISDNGDKLSRLDRVLVCLGFIENWPTTALTALDRYITDHRPLLMNVIPSDFGHIPFRFFNSWLEFPGFVEYVMFLCRSFHFVGPADLRLATKLRWLKNRIKDWVKAEKSRGNELYVEKRKLIAALELIAEERELSPTEQELRTEYKQFIWEQDRLKDLDTRQKSRARWALEGDENSRFFHVVVKSNTNTNRINGVLVEGEWVTNPVTIKQHFYEFYSKMFSEPMSTRPPIVCPNLKSLSATEAESLEATFSLAEIKNAIWECDGDRAPGPDGFNFKFIKRCWEGLQNDFLNLFDEFFFNGSINKSCTSSFITLIPKIKDPLSPADFRPISLIGCINKVISKVLVNRLKGVIGKLISEEQSAVICGRNITDGPLMLNELLAWMKTAKKSGMFFKVDIHKAYDSLNWNFLQSIMMQMNFPAKWITWIMATLHSSHGSVLVNGSPTMEFNCTRGLRQGDPLSPFLFLLAMEALSGIMKKASSVGLFQGIKCATNGPTLTHLLYADDVVFIGTWSLSNVLNLRRILRCFYLASGLKVNLCKSKLFGVGVGSSEVDEMANTLYCKAGAFPFKYLGLQVGGNMNLVKNWKPVMEVFKNRLSIWKGKTLSYGGRITLIKSVLSSLPTYYFSLYRAPAQVIKNLESIRRTFFWGGTEDKSKANWIAWDNVISSVEYGGVGFGSLKDANLAMLAKWWWRFKVEKEGLWRKVIWAIHNKSRSWNFIPAKISIPGPWKQIWQISGELERAELNLTKQIRGVLGNGADILFWVDTWVGESPLAYSFPALFNLEMDKMCTVADRLWNENHWPQWNWNWNRAPSSSAEIAELQQLIQYTSGVQCEDRRDRWVWDLDPNGLFSVRSIKNHVQNHNRVAPQSIFKWNNWIPKKVGVVGWRAMVERLPTKVALLSKGIHPESVTCIFCNEQPETSEHIFVDCQFAQTVWTAIAQWCKVSAFYAFSLKDVLQVGEYVDGSAKRKKAIHAISLVYLWSVWRMRNEVIFQNASVSVQKVVEEIKRMSFQWVKYRSKEACLNWESWRRFNVF